MTSSTEIILSPDPARARRLRGSCASVLLGDPDTVGIGSAPYSPYCISRGRAENKRQNWRVARDGIKAARPMQEFRPARLLRLLALPCVE